MDILPTNIDLSAAEIQLVSEVAREQTLQRVLAAAATGYDVILIDCAPSLGLLTINALTAADKVIMPMECEFFALRGIALLTDTITKVQDRLNPDLEILGILGTMYDPRTLHTREVLERVVRGVRRRGLPLRHPADDQVPGDHGGRRADHHVRDQLARGGVVPDAGPGGAAAVSRRVRLPGASELFRPTGTERRADGSRADGTASDRATSGRRSVDGRRAAAPGGSGTTRRSPCTSAATSCWRSSRPGCGLRGEHGLAVDRGRMVRAAMALALADLETAGADGELVRRLTAS